MKAFISILFFLIVTFVMASVVQADMFNPATDDSYGIWFDRDGGTGSSLLGSQVVSDGTPGIYDVVIRYHAVDANTATMFATVNGIQQGFYVGGYPNDFTKAGKSFTSDSLDAMQIFWWSRFPVWKAGEVGILDISATGNLGTITYSDLVWTKAGVGPASYPQQIDAGEFSDVWDLMAGDLILSFTVDFEDVWGNATTYNTLMFEFGLKPEPLGITANPVGGGWMGSVQVDFTESPGSWYLNDKFDLQVTGTDAEWQYNVVPEPASIFLLAVGLAGVGLLRRRFKY